MPTHANAPLTPEGRRRMVRAIERGASLRRAAAEFSVALATAHRWWHRWRCADQLQRASGSCLCDRSSRPHRSPRRLSAAEEAPILAARRQTNLGPGRLAHICRRQRSTIHKVLLPPRHQPPAGCATAAAPPLRVVAPGALLHVDTTRLARFAQPGHRTRGRGAPAHANEGMGAAVIHVAIDDHSRYAYLEQHADERGVTCAASSSGPCAHFCELGMADVEALMSDNARNYRTARVFQAVLARHDIRHILIPPYSPWWNGKCERFIQTLKSEWAYAHEWPSSAARARALGSWLRTYNRQRRHSSLGDRPPISRVPNVCGQRS